MHPDLAKVAMAFLARVELKGAEAPALMELIKVLEALANPAQLPGIADQVPSAA